MTFGIQGHSMSNVTVSWEIYDDWLAFQEIWCYSTWWFSCIAFDERQTRRMDAGRRLPHDNSSVDPVKHS